MNDWLIAIFGPIILALLAWVGSKIVGALAKIGQIHHQVFPNSGGSLFDKITGIETAVKTHDAKFKAYQDADGVATFYADGTGRLYWLSTGMKDLFNVEHREALLGAGMFDSIVDDERSNVRRRWDSTFADFRQFDCNVEIRIPTDNGAHELRWVRVVATPVAKNDYSGYVRTVDAK